MMDKLWDYRWWILGGGGGILLLLLLLRPRDDARLQQGPVYLPVASGYNPSFEVSLPDTTQEQSPYIIPGPVDEDLAHYLGLVGRTSPNIADAFYNLWTRLLKQFWEIIRPIQERVANIETTVSTVEAAFRTFQQQYDAAIRELSGRTGQKLTDLETRLAALETWRRSLYSSEDDDHK